MFCYLWVALDERVYPTFVRRLCKVPNHPDPFRDVNVLDENSSPLPFWQVDSG